MSFSRVTVLVLDGVGIGEAPDADDYGDVGSHSLANSARVAGGLHCPNMAAMGLGAIESIKGVPVVDQGAGGFGKMTPHSAGKDTVTGHWELMGIQLENPFPTYPDGFPTEVIFAFEAAIGRSVIGNKASSGTVILEELGEEHVRTGSPIVYTSADSVFQIAAHEEVVSLSELYEICEKARALLSGRHGVGRVIARPFIGNDAGSFTRTAGRKDYPMLPEKDTLMDLLIAKGLDVLAVGKIDDIFGHRGITRSNHTPDNASSLLATEAFLKETFTGLLFVNLIECDMIYGHRNDPKGYVKAIENVDAFLPRLMNQMSDEDLMMIVADHGVDPTTPGTDHSREYVPLMVWSPCMNGMVNLGTRETFSDVAATLGENFKVNVKTPGHSFMSEIHSAIRD